LREAREAGLLGLRFTFLRKDTALKEEKGNWLRGGENLIAAQQKKNKKEHHYQLLTSGRKKKKGEEEHGAGPGTRGVLTQRLPNWAECYRP